MGDVDAGDAVDLAGDGEGGVDPAVGVHHVVGDLLDDAVDRVADVLARGHQEGTYHKDDKGGLVVQPKNALNIDYLG